MLPSIILLSSLLGLGYALPSSANQPDPAFGNHSVGNATQNNHVMYFQANDPASNYIVALKIDSRDGKVSSPVKTNTGGKGLAGLFAVSQDSVVVDHHYLFVTNAGSNTLSLFLINPNDPQHPTLIGNPAPTLGQTPVSVTYSHKLKTACVANAGSTAGLTCFSVSRTRGLTPLTPLLPIPQTQLADPTPTPPAPLVLIADIVFNPSSTALFASIRSNGRDPGLLYAYPVTAAGTISPAYTVTPFPSLVFLFSMNFLNSDERMIVTNPHAGSPGAAILKIAYPSLKATVEEVVTIPRQQASCWVAYAPRYSEYAYVMDAAAPNVTIVDPRVGSGEAVAVVNFETPTAGAGVFDTKLDREWLYALTDDPADSRVNVWELESGGRGLRLVQGFEVLREVGMVPYRMGLAVWPAST